MGKAKKEEESGAADKSSVAEPSYEEKLKFTSVIAKPMASKKLTKKVRVKMAINRLSLNTQSFFSSTSASRRARSTRRWCATDSRTSR